MVARTSASVRAGSILTAGAAILALSVPAATASPVFTDAATQLSGGASASTSGVNCTESLSATLATNVPVVENGPAASLTQPASATFANTGNASDNGSATASATLTAQVTSAGGSMRTIEATGRGTAHFADTLPTSACDRDLDARAQLSATFVIAQPGIVTLQATGDGTMGGELEIRTSGPSSSKAVFVDASGLPTDSHTRAFVLPGSYDASAGVDMNAGGTTSTPDINGAVSLQMSFAPAGSQSAAATGKAKKYVVLPASRTCAGHDLTPTITAKKKRAGKIKQLEFFLGDQRVAKVRKIKAGATVVVPLPDNQDADVRVEVTLLPRHHGQKPKVVKETASYVACTV